MKSFILIFSLLLIALGCSEQKSNPTLPATHPTEWMDSESADFHGKAVFSLGTKSCQKCHGEDLNGGLVEVSCIDCHLETGSCTTCHGGLDNNSGAPPYGLESETDDTTLAVGAHTAHLNGTTYSDPIECSTCHIVPVTSADQSHFDLNINQPLDNIAEINWGNLASLSEATWDRTTGQCQNVYCHGGFEGGNNENNPVWNSSEFTACGSCHDAGADLSALTYHHDFHVNTAGLSCADCHATVMGGQFQIIDKSLHINGNVEVSVADQTLCDDCHSGGNSCITCHGGTDNQSGAPPVGLEGETMTSQVAVGAHTKHLEGGNMADGFECAVCHIPVGSIAAPSHLDNDGIAEVTFNDFAGASSQWNRNNENCANTYCHGNFNGGDNATPLWTTTGQIQCGSCHDIGSNPERLKWKHKFHIEQAGLDCSECHSDVVDNALNIIDLALHVDGNVDVFVADSTSCNSCHGPNPGSCTFCHGGIDNQTGAPPKGIEGETETSDLAVGAHTAHIDGGLISDGFECVSCHITPTSWDDNLHLGNDNIAEITWGGLSGQSPDWNRVSATCSDTYCHGDFRGGNINQPVWTSMGQADCGSCHDVGSNPNLLLDDHYKHVFEEELGCFECHDNTVDASLNIINKSLHVDGKNDVAFNRAPNGIYAANTCSNVGVGGCHDTDEPEPW